MFDKPVFTFENRRARRDPFFSGIGFTSPAFHVWISLMIRRQCRLISTRWRERDNRFDIAFAGPRLQTGWSIEIARWYQHNVVASLTGSLAVPVLGRELFVLKIGCFYLLRFGEKTINSPLHITKKLCRSALQSEVEIRPAIKS
jgi:hypothetical protein